MQCVVEEGRHHVDPRRELQHRRVPQAAEEGLPEQVHREEGAARRQEVEGGVEHGHRRVGAATEQEPFAHRPVLARHVPPLRSGSNRSFAGPPWVPGPTFEAAATDVDHPVVPLRGDLQHGDVEHHNHMMLSEYAARKLLFEASFWLQGASPR